MESSSGATGWGVADSEWRTCLYRFARARHAIPGLSLQRQGDQVAEATLRQGVLAGKQPVIGRKGEGAMPRMRE